MAPAPSSTSSSERTGGRRPLWQEIAWYVAGLLVVLGAFEAIVAARFSMPPEAREPQGSLVRYFSYGLSIEAKLRRSVGVQGQEPTAVVRAGWIPTELYAPPADWDAGGPRTIFYGMSFTNKIADAVQQIDPSVSVMVRAGPSAPLSHSYALFESDPWRSEADCIVVGVLSSSLPYMQAMMGAGYTPESPAPYAFPKFSMVGGALQRIDPVISDRDQFIEAFRAGSPLWQQHLETIAQHDGYWDPLVFRASMTDRSALLRLLRRAWASRRVGVTAKNVYSYKTGYMAEHPAMAAVPELLSRMHARCQASDQQFVVILLHARGEPGHLDAWLGEDLRAAGITVLSTTDFFSSTDAANFVGDGHYTHERSEELARSVLSTIE